MARMRCVKPSLFQHEPLHKAEIETRLPLRLAYVGLWCQCDKEGRFKWRPSELKVNVLPWDAVDFAAILDALCRYDFIRRYEVDGQVYGYVPTWQRHQKPHHQETPSAIPAPPDFAPSSEPLHPRNNSLSTLTLTVNGDSNSNSTMDEAAAADPFFFSALKNRGITESRAKFSLGAYGIEGVQTVLAWFDRESAAGKIRTPAAALKSVLKEPEEWGFTRVDGRLIAPSDGRNPDAFARMVQEAGDRFAMAGKAR
jgi:hypothetical protein